MATGLNGVIFGLLVLSLIHYLCERFVLNQEFMDDIGLGSMKFSDLDTKTLTELQKLDVISAHFGRLDTSSDRTKSSATRPVSRHKVSICLARLLSGE